MAEGRPRAVIVVAGAAIAASIVGYFVWPSPKPALDCSPDQVHLGPDGVARCGPGAPLPAGAKLAIGAKLDLNGATADDLAELPGIGPSLAKQIIDARSKTDGGFRGWEELDAVPGVGSARLETLKGSVEIR